MPPEFPVQSGVGFASAGGGGDTLSSLLSSAELRKLQPPPAPAIRDLVSKPKRKTPKERRVPHRICFGPFPVYQDYWIVGRAYMNVMKRKSVRLHINVVTYSNGRYPFMKKNRVAEAYTLRIALPALEQALIDAQHGGVRIQKLAAHKWRRKVYRLLKEGSHVVKA